MRIVSRLPSTWLCHCQPKHQLRRLSPVLSRRSSASSPSAEGIRYPDAPSTEHHNTASYAAYAERTGLDKTSKLFVGTQYEYTVVDALKRLGYNVRRVGGRSDGGIDLVGTWSVPSTPEALRVLIQCKATAQNTKVGPHLIRELEGTFVAAPVGWRGPGVLGVLTAQKPATKGMRESLGRSRWPMGYISCSKDGRVEQMLWNRRAEEAGLEGLGVGVQFIDASEDQPGQPDQRLVLTWKGKPHDSSEKAGLDTSI
jgi:hypothetical protein